MIRHRNVGTATLLYLGLEIPPGGLVPLEADAAWVGSFLHTGVLHPVADGPDEDAGVAKEAGKEAP